MKIPGKAIERFWKHVEKTDDASCWNYTGYILNSGYGHFVIGKKRIRAHRLSWLINNGEIPEGMLICHTCDNRKCVNPKHLFIGTNKDNALDREEKGRGAHNNTKPQYGEKNGLSKLTRFKVDEILELYKESGCTQQALADEFNVSRSTISHITTGRIWKEVSK